MFSTGKLLAGAGSTLLARYGGGGGRLASSWQLVSGAIVERPASLVRPFNPFESAYAQLLIDIEAENSLLSDHELRAIDEKKSREKAAKSGSAALKVKLTEDILAEWKAELAEFNKRYQTQQTQANNSKLDDSKRCLDQSLTVLVKQKLGDQAHWLFPQTNHQEGETLRQSAERAVAECLGEALQIQALGNAPCAFYKYKYPKAVQDKTGAEGAKVFYFKVQYRSGDAQLNKSLATELVWATHDELLERLAKPVLRAVRPALFVAPQIDFTPLLDSVAEKEQLEKLQLNVNKAKAKN